MNPLNSVRGVITAGIILAVVIAAATMGRHFNELSLVVWIHVLAGITWIGLLYYFNFVQVTKYVAPRALWWFRWGAALTWLSGAYALYKLNMLGPAFHLGLGGDSFNAQAMVIGVGAWLGTIMLFNVWVLIWPNQKKVLGLVEASADEIVKAKNIAFLASRSNTLMSIPMVMSMVGAGHGWFM